MLDRQSRYLTTLRRVPVRPCGIAVYIPVRGLAGTSSGADFATNRATLHQLDITDPMIAVSRKRPRWMPTAAKGSRVRVRVLRFSTVGASVLDDAMEQRRSVVGTIGVSRSRE